MVQFDLLKRSSDYSAHCKSITSFAQGYINELQLNCTTGVDGVCMDSWPNGASVQAAEFSTLDHPQDPSATESINRKKKPPPQRKSNPWGHRGSAIGRGTDLPWLAVVDAGIASQANKRSCHCDSRHLELFDK